MITLRNNLDSDTSPARPGPQDDFFETYGFRIFKALRRIMHAVDSHSRKLNEQFHITGPQLLCLYALIREDIHTQAELVRNINLGGSTVNGIIDRLEAKGLVSRTRSSTDRRRVILAVTDDGRALAREAASLLQTNFSEGLKALPDLEQATIALSLERVVDLMQNQVEPPDS